MNEKKVMEYLESKGISFMPWDNDLKDLKRILEEDVKPYLEKEPDSWIETGSLRFAKTKSGRIYCQFQPRRCYLD